MHHCSMCPFFAPLRSELIKHLTSKHRNSPNFIIHCAAQGCGASFRNVRTFQKHCYRHHTHNEDEAIQNAPLGNDEQFENDAQDINPLDMQESKKIIEAQYILKLKAFHNLSQIAVDDIIGSTKLLIEEHCSSIKNKLLQIDPAELTTEAIEEAFMYESFNELETEYLQENYCQKTLGLIKPVAVKLGQTTGTKKVRQKTRFAIKECVGYFIPFLEQLETLLCMPEVKSHLDMERAPGEMLTDFFDGHYYQKQYFQQHPGSLLFVLYHDEFEIANPIGSHKKKHKLAVFYWSLLNLPPESRFKIQAQQLLAIAKASYLKKFDIQPLLSDFITGLRVLHNGFNIDNKIYFGTLYCVLGDTPAAQWLGGFKEGVSFAQKPCRTCEIRHDSLGESLSGDEYPLRDEDEHIDRCNLLSELSGENKKYWSKHYGIVRRSLLLDIPEFQATQCILQDPMHILLEGIVKMELQLVLSSFIERSYFSLAVLNSIIRNYQYCADMKNDKPPELESKSLKRESVFPMTAVETLNFMQLLPFMIGDMVPEGDEIWMNYLQIVQITALVISPLASQKSIATLKQLIFSHNYNFKKLFPHVNFTPKLHYLTHFPRQIILFGPARNHWCMRFEAKHGLFKMKKWRSFKSLEKSVALYHQRWMCLQQSGVGNGKSETYLYKGDVVREGIVIPVDLTPCEIKNYIQEHFDCLVHQDILQTDSVNIHEISYALGKVLLYEYSENSEPVFAVIDQIYVIDNLKCFHCTKLKILGFNSHLNAFECQRGHDTLVTSVGRLTYKWPQLVHFCENIMYVMLRNVDFSWCI